MFLTPFFFFFFFFFFAIKLVVSHPLLKTFEIIYICFSSFFKLLPVFEDKGRWRLQMSGQDMSRSMDYGLPQIKLEKVFQLLGYNSTSNFCSCLLSKPK